MYGIEAITYHNGWAMAVAGALIVFTGLSLLCFVISQLHKIVELWQRRGQSSDDTATPSAAPDRIEIPVRFSDDPAETARFYRQLVMPLAPGFALSELYRASVENNFPHPHISIRQLRQAGFLIARGDGIFDWKE